MGCNDNFQQIRLGERLYFEWDNSGDPVAEPLSEADAIDLGAASFVGLTIVISEFTGDNITWTFRSAPINNLRYYTPVKASGASVTITVSADGASFQSAMDALSRFFMLAPSIGSPSQTTSCYATIDVIVKG